MKHFTPEEDKYLIENRNTIPCKRMAQNLGRAEVTARQRLKLLGFLPSPEAVQRFKEQSRIQKGNVPPNKGRKQSEYMKPEAIARTEATRFKRGQKVWNTKPIGYERITKDGYKERKIAEPRTFKAVHRIVWEEIFGPIPKGMIVVFKDYDQLNCDPLNLMVLSRSENMKRNSYHNYGKDIALTIQLRGALNRQINKHIKKLKQ